MRIITYCRINISTGETLEEQAYEYDGPVALCAHDPASSDGYGGSNSGGQGGFGGLGIGNPGSYGGQQSVGAPGFSGGYGNAGGEPSYSDTQIAQTNDSLLGKVVDKVLGFLRKAADLAIATNPVGLAAQILSKLTTDRTIAQNISKYISEGMKAVDATTKAVNESDLPDTAKATAIQSIKTVDDPEGILGGRLTGSEGSEKFVNADGKDMFNTTSDTASDSTADPDRPLFDQYMDKWLGVPSYDSTEAQTEFKNYFKNTPPGTTQDWAGGTLTMGENGIATYTPAGGAPVKITADSDMSDLYNTYDGIADTWDKTYQSSTAEDAIKGHAGYIGEAAQKYQDTIQGATDEQNSLLSNLMSDAESGTGMFKPISFGLGNQNISFVPGAQRKLATQLSELGQKKLGNTTQTASDLLKTSGMTSPYVGELSYLDALKTAMGEEESRRTTDEKLKYDYKALADKIGIDQKQLEQNEPGWLDELAGLNNILGKGGFLQGLL